MALTRKFLASKGLEAEVIEDIISAHVETVNALKDKLDDAEKHKDKAEKYDEAKKKLDELEAEIAKNGDKDYAALKKEFDDFKEEVAKKEARTAKEAAYKEILKDAGIPEKHFAKIIKYSDVDSIEVDNQGKIKNANDLLKAIKEEWSDHIVKQDKKGSDTANPPGGTGGGAKKTKEEIMKIQDVAERQQAMLENPEVFGI